MSAGDQPDMPGFDDEGVRWMGTREELDAWKSYKREKALDFVRRGYSVSWYPDGDNWMDIYLPERDHARMPEIRAVAKIYSSPSEHGIAGGCVSKLMIYAERNDGAYVMGRPSRQRTVLFNYDRGPDVNWLHTMPLAQKLYEAVLEELN